MPPGADPKALKGIKEAWAKAKELAPQIEKVAGEAVQALTEKNVTLALPKEEKALELLREIAKSLPKQDRQEGEQPQDGGQQQQEQQDQAKQEKGQINREQAEAVLRRAREREKEYQDRKQKMMRGFVGSGGVDRDW